MTGDAIVLSSRVRLARNYEDLPFDTARQPDLAAMCIARTADRPSEPRAGGEKGHQP